MSNESENNGYGKYVNVAVDEVTAENMEQLATEWANRLATEAMAFVESDDVSLIKLREGVIKSLMVLMHIIGHKLDPNCALTQFMVLVQHKGESIVQMDATSPLNLIHVVQIAIENYIKDCIKNGSITVIGNDDTKHIRTEH